MNLLREKKTVIVYVSKDKKYYTLHVLSDLEKLLSKYDKTSLESLEKKLQLSHKRKKQQEAFKFV